MLISVAFLVKSCMLNVEVLRYNDRWQVSMKPCSRNLFMGQCDNIQVVLERDSKVRAFDVPHHGELSVLVFNLRCFVQLQIAKLFGPQYLLGFFYHLFWLLPNFLPYDNATISLATDLENPARAG